MKKKILIFLGICMNSICMQAQSVLTPLEDWSTTSGSQTFFYKNVTKLRESILTSQVQR